MTSFETGVYNHAEQAVQRAYSKPRGNYGRMLSDDVYDGLSVFDKLVQDSMVKRIIEETCTEIVRDVFRLQYDDTMPEKDLAELADKIIAGLCPPSMSKKFARECLQRWSGRRICDWRIMDIGKRAATWSMSRGTLDTQASRLRRDLNDIKEGGLLMLRLKLEEEGLMT